MRHSPIGNSARRFRVCINAQTPTLSASSIVQIRAMDICSLRANQQATEKEQNMLGVIAVILIVLWLLGFFAFHVTTGFIHIVLVVALVMLILHFVRGRN
jgi:hypothetical protein